MSCQGCFCSDSLQIDPLTGTGGSLLDSTRQKSHLPKIIFTNTSADIGVEMLP